MLTAAQVKGDVRLNGQPYTNTELKWMSAYVMQDDLLNGHLTVVETLTYTAELRLPKDSTASQIRERVEQVMQDMNLKHVSDVIVGTPLKKGISGGERKRLCVAMELLTKPLLLFLDEPTSGLDSVAAMALCQKLKDLCDAGTCTVVCTIHQPQVGSSSFGHDLYTGKWIMRMSRFVSLLSYFCLCMSNTRTHTCTHFDTINSYQICSPSAAGQDLQPV